MGDLLKLGVVFVGAWAGYRAYEAGKVGVPLDLAFKYPTRPLALLRTMAATPPKVANVIQLQPGGLPDA